MQGPVPVDREIIVIDGVIPGIPVRLLSRSRIEFGGHCPGPADARGVEIVADRHVKRVVPGWAQSSSSVMVIVPLFNRTAFFIFHGNQPGCESTNIMAADKCP